MADALSLEVRAEVTVTETLSGDDILGTYQVPHAGYNHRLALDGTTTPDLTGGGYKSATIGGGGTGSIDLTDLTLGAAVTSLSGKQPRALMLYAPDTNAGDVTVTKGASNGYGGLGGSFSLVLKPGMGQLVWWSVDNATAVGGTAKILDLAGTSGDVVQVSAGAGS